MKELRTQEEIAGLANKLLKYIIKNQNCSWIDVCEAFPKKKYRRTDISRALTMLDEEYNLMERSDDDRVNKEGKAINTAVYTVDLEGLSYLKRILCGIDV